VVLQDARECRAFRKPQQSRQTAATLLALPPFKVGTAESSVLANNSKACGVSAKGPHRIQYDFMLDGARYRPTLPGIPTEANLNRARAHLEDIKARIKARIKAGTFIFEEEFPDYRHMERVIDPSQIRTCNQVFDQFLEHCEARLARHDLAASTLSTYRRILDKSLASRALRQTLPEDRPSHTQPDCRPEQAMEQEALQQRD
jgi:hypothetical protein